MKYLLALLIFCCASEAHARRFIWYPVPGGYVKVYIEPKKPAPRLVVPELPSYPTGVHKTIPQRFVPPLLIENPYVD